jgi:DNA-directed RNA polymerase specialized sigma24 family protein
VEDRDEFGERFIRAWELARWARNEWIQLSDVEQAFVLAVLELKQRAPRQYAVFVMRAIRGFVPNQIAAILDITIDAVYQHDHRARATIAARLAAFEEVRTWLQATGRRPAAGSARSVDDGEGET